MALLHRPPDLEVRERWFLGLTAWQLVVVVGAVVLAALVVLPDLTPGTPMPAAAAEDTPATLPPPPTSGEVFAVAWRWLLAHPRVPVGAAIIGAGYGLALVQVQHVGLGPWLWLGLRALTQPRRTYWAPDPADEGWAPPPSADDATPDRDDADDEDDE